MFIYSLIIIITPINKYVEIIYNYMCVDVKLNSCISYCFCIRFVVDV